jgi:uncharacterized protein YdaU (DUF1376 family)
MRSADIIAHPSAPWPVERHAQRSSARFWMKHDVKAFAFETSTADAEGAGALILLRGHYFLTGSLPKTDAECAKVCRLGVRKFARLRPWLFSFFDGEGKSADLDASISETEQIIEKRRAAGRKGGAGKALTLAKQNARQSESQLQSQLQKEPESLSLSSPPAPTPLLEPRPRESEEVGAQALASLPVSARAHPGWRGLAAWIDRLLGDGVDRADIVVGIAQCLRSLKDQPPSTFGYFNAAIDRAREARMRPLPETTPRQSGHHELGPAGETLRKRLGNDDVFAAWFGGAKLVGVSGGTVTISVCTSFKQSRVVTHYEAVCIDAFRRADASVNRLAVIVEAAR